MKRQNLIKSKRESSPKISTVFCRTKSVFRLFRFAFISAFIFLFSSDFKTLKISAEDSSNELENAIYTRQEFFGADAIVPLPTAQARENLLKLAENEPDNPQILNRLAEFDEKLLRFVEAENLLIRLAEFDAAKLETVAAFYNRHAQFEKEAEVLRKILATTEMKNRPQIFSRLIYVARMHDLKNYLQPDFYAQIADENPEVSAIFETLADNLVKEENYAEALKFVRSAKTKFPERQNVLLEKETNILLEMNDPKEAEKIYQAAFDPLWSNDEAEKFYSFLSNQDRLRAYGAEIKARFKKNPADFDAAIRLALYQNHDFVYGNDEIAPLILKLEQAKKNWTIDELLITTRLLLQANEADAASRFLYTLYRREDFNSNAERRAKILYQLFEMFSDAGNQKLPLTKGDLRFYEDVAKVDIDPGIATGILSLIFSDAKVREKFDEQETRANKFFNRAAAYRIFLEYKKEFPTSPELAQMYLDIVRLYTATKETEIAENTLNEFAERYENAGDFASVALKLADAFAVTKKPEKTREIYQKILDYLGKQGKLLAPQTENKNQDFDVSPISSDFENKLSENSNKEKSKRNDGINIPNRDEKPIENYDEPISNFHDYLGKKSDAVTYAEVLEKFVASLAKEKKTTEILALYSNEIAKYPNEEWLYEQRLTWLEKTNLTDEQLKVYQQALNKFPLNRWRDKLARWFLRRNRQADFADFSTDLIGKLNDADAQNYLSQFVDAKISATEFDRQLYLKLYQTAHERFPHNLAFVSGLLRFYKTNNQLDEWRELSARYYFESKQIRESFLDDLSAKGDLRNYLEKSKSNESTIYELFRADANARLSNYENAVDAYRKLNQIYPNTPEFSERLINFTRSLGQKNRNLLAESANVAQTNADFLASSAERRTQSGEIFAELGDYQKSGEEWDKLISTASGEQVIYLDAATVYWDYFQYDDARRTIKLMREKFGDDALYAFETGAILEAQKKLPEAVGEYVKAFDANGDEMQKEKATNRLVILTARNADTQNAITKAFEVEKNRRIDASALALGYAEFLAKIKKPERAEKILNREIANSRDQNFLEAVEKFYASEDIKTGEQVALKRLAETSESSRAQIKYQFQLADFFEENQNPNAVAEILTKLVRQFPTNFGVLDEASNRFRRSGFENKAVEVLQNALPRSRGAYRNRLARKLSALLIKLDRLDSAERILVNLHDENKADIEIFRELAGVCVRTGNADLMRKLFSETIAALRQSDMDRRELDAQITDLRESMIDAFTRLKDYSSAIEQLIEIINREPDDEALTENAIRYVQRYGGAETLLSYYLQISAQSFKNYRWNVVLAKIYEARGDLENSEKNYRAAIVNQPEMVELYVALADLEAKRNEIDEALKAFDTILELTNDAPEFARKKIELLKKVGRFAEAEKEQAKLPADAKSKIRVDEFAEAEKIQLLEQEKARALFREAFEKLLADPLSGEIKAAYIPSYVTSVREVESLAQINLRLWQLREKLIVTADENDSTDAGEARKRLEILDGAIIESIGNVAKNFGTPDELADLHKDLQRRIGEISFASDTHQTLSLVQNLSRRANFGDLEELILVRKLNESNSPVEKQNQLRILVSFYNERGAYQKTFDALETYQSDDLPQLAEAARLIGNKEKELESLRKIYWSANKISVSTNENIARYLEIIAAEDRAELESLTEKSSAYQLQLINFLLAKGERELAHQAIENADLPAAWKAARNAETSLALKEFDDPSECYFCAALKFESIGDFQQQTPDKKQFLINDDWFRLTREYGEWLEEKAQSQSKSSVENFAEANKYLPAMIENQPRNAAQQVKLGEFYLERKQLESAIKSLRIAVELEPENKLAWSLLGAAYYSSGRRDFAEECWSKVLADETIESGSIYFQVLQKYDLAEQARGKLPPIIVKFLQTNNADQSADFQNLIRAIAESFNDEAQKRIYFLQILNQRLTDISLARMLIDESLIGKNQSDDFYKLLIERSDNYTSYDFDFTAALKRVWTNVDAESIVEQENDYRIEEPSGERFEWQKNYLKSLVERGENVRAEALIAEIEKDLRGRYARPAWLKLARLNLQIRAGKFDLAEAEQFVGIRVSEAVAEIKLPSVERFNDLLQILKEEKRDDDAAQISESFFARNLALQQLNAANFAGLARVFFQKSEPEKALQILQLMVKANTEIERQTALAEIAAIDVVELKEANGAKISLAENDSIDEPNALQIAAEIAAEFQQTDAAIQFRRQLAEVNPANFSNRIELAKLLVTKRETPEATDILTQINGDRNSLRTERWQAQIVLREIGAKVEIAAEKYDSFSQNFNGIVAAENNQLEAAIEFFTRSLIADKDAEMPTRRELIKVYAASNNFFAALKLAEIDKSAKSDELLQTLSEAAEKVGDFTRAINFEKSKSIVSEERVWRLQKLADAKNRAVTNLKIDLENTRKL